MPGNNKSALLSFHDELHEQISFKLSSWKLVTHQTVLGSICALLPCCSNKAHRYNIKILVSNKTDKRSMVPRNPFRIIRSTRCCPIHGSFSANFRWKDCRYCLVVGQLEDLLCEDGSQFCPPVDELSLLRLVQLLNAANPEFENLKFHFLWYWVSPYLLDHFLRLHTWLLVRFADQATSSSFKWQVSLC